MTVTGTRTVIVVVSVVEVTMVAVELMIGVEVLVDVVVTGQGVTVFLKNEEQSAEPLALPGAALLATTAR